MLNLYIILFLMDPTINVEASKVEGKTDPCSRLNLLENVITGPIQEQPNKFSLLYQSFPPDCQLIPPRETRVLMFPNHRESNLTFEFPFKYSTSVNVLLSPVLNVSHDLPVFSTGMNLGLSITTIFVLLQPNPLIGNSFRSRIEINLPALKFKLYFYSDTKIQAKIECNAYCFDNDITVETLQNNLHEPKLLHKKLFRRGLGNLVYAKIHQLYKSDEVLPASVCSKILRRGLRKLMFCSPNIFSVNEFSKVHNLSIVSFHNLEKFSRMVPVMYEAQALHGMFYGLNFSTVSKFYTTGFLFSEFDSFSFLYCQLTRGDDETKDLEFWVQPFKVELWIALIFIMAMCCIYSQAGLRDNNKFAVEVCESAFKFIEVLIGNGNINNSLFQLCLAYLGFFVCLFYSSCLLGFVVMESPPAPYTSIKEILTDGYKILLFPQTGVKDNLSPDLKLRGIDPVSKAFPVYDDVLLRTPGLTVSFVADQLMEKRLVVSDTSVAQRNLRVWSIVLNQHTDVKYECHVLPEAMHAHSFFWIMYTINRDWIRITMNRLVEAGLQKMWIEWGERAFRLALELEEKVTGNSDGDDKIGIRKFLFVLNMLQGTGITLAILSLICEKFITLYIQSIDQEQ